MDSAALLFCCHVCCHTAHCFKPFVNPTDTAASNCGLHILWGWAGGCGGAAVLSLLFLFGKRPLKTWNKRPEYITYSFIYLVQMLIDYLGQESTGRVWIWTFTESPVVHCWHFFLPLFFFLLLSDFVLLELVFNYPIAEGQNPISRQSHFQDAGEAWMWAHGRWRVAGKGQQRWHLTLLNKLKVFSLSG